jgi:gluconolactonase
MLACSLAVHAYHNLPANMISAASGTAPLQTMITQKTCTFAEGPAPHPTQGYLLYSCFRAADGIRKVQAGAETTFKADALTNGLVFDGSGKLFGVQRQGPSRVIEIDVATQQVKPLTTQTFTSLNDLALDNVGGIYFTDYGGNTVYYRSAAGAVTEIDGALNRPNGVNISPDGAKLIVSDHGADVIYTYQITAPGTVTGKQSFYTGATRPDGMAVDSAGNLWTSSSTGVHVLSPTGALLGQVSTANPPTGNFAVSNVALAVDKTLYVTASDGSVYSLPTLMAGQALPGTPSPPPAGGGTGGGSFAPPPPLAAGGGQASTASGDSTGGISGGTVGGVLLLLAIAGGVYWYTQKKKAGGAGGGVTMTQAAPPPPQPGAPGYVAPAPLPEGWQEMKDEKSGQAYFYNSATGESSWVRPGGDKG